MTPCGVICNRLYTACRERSRLLDAIDRRQYAKVKRLLEAGYDANAEHSHLIPLIRALHHDDERMVDVLVKGGARVHQHGCQSTICPLWYTLAFSSNLTILRIVIRAALRADYNEAQCQLLHPPITPMVMTLWRNPICAQNIFSMLTAANLSIGRMPIDDTNPFLGTPALLAENVERAGFELLRDDMAEIAIGLATVRLPALLVVMILQEACMPPNVEIRMHRFWQVAVLVKNLQRARFPDDE